MPAQSLGASTPEYAVGDTGPDLADRLHDADGNPIDLTGATVVINIAYASRSYYYSPMQRIIDGSACTIDPDQTEEGNRGWVYWTPHDLTLAGTFRYTYEITYPGGARQTIAPSAENTLTVRAPIGGMQYA